MTATHPGSEPGSESVLDPVIETDRERDALLVIDLQPDFMSGGCWPSPRGRGRRRSPPCCRGFTPSWRRRTGIRPGISSAAPDKGALFSTVPLYGGEQIAVAAHCVQGSVGKVHVQRPAGPIG